MRKISTVTFLASILAVCSVKAQDCKAYFPMKEGVKFEITNYSAKGKAESKAIHEVYSVMEEGGDVIAAVRTEIHLEKGKDDEPAILEYEVKCEGGKFVISRIGGMSMNEMEMMSGDIEVTGDYFEVPSDPSPGMTLPDGAIVMSFVTGDNGGMAMNITTNVSNRKVEAIENVETPAGSFESVKLTYDVQTKVLLTFKSKAAEWYSEGVGMVRSEVYNKNGKLQSYSVLTSIEGL